MRVPLPEQQSDCSYRCAVRVELEPWRFCAHELQNVIVKTNSMLIHYSPGTHDAVSGESLLVVKAFLARKRNGRRICDRQAPHSSRESSHHAKALFMM